jgi:anaerobic magnesium-protoporphyrin IX monomethyl ester cyclase
MSKNVLLIHAPFGELGFGKDWQKTASLAAPLGLMYLAEPLIRAGYNVEFIDLNVDQLTETAFEKAVRDKQFVLISTYSDSLSNVKRLIVKISEINRAAFVLCGGPYCTLSRKYVEGSDITFVGEAEGVIVDLLERMTEGRSLNHILGLIYRDGDRVFRNEGVCYVKDLDTTQHASLTLSKGKNYGDVVGFTLDDVIGIMTSRGCPFKCRYCTHKGVVPYRKRSVESVLSELEELVKNGVKYVVFYDDNFLVDKKRAIGIMDGIIQRKIRIKIILQGRVDSADYELYKKMRKAGVAVIMFGIENGNQDVLDGWNKGITIQQIEEAVALANKVGIITFGWFIIGSALEDRAHFLNNLAFLRRIPLDWININILGYYEGSPLWEEAVANGLISKNETKVYANEVLSYYSYVEWLDLKDQLLKAFFKKKLRTIRISIKTVRLGVLGIFLKMITNKSFYENIRSPFVQVEEEKTLSS